MEVRCRLSWGGKAKVRKMLPRCKVFEMTHTILPVAWRECRLGHGLQEVA